MRAFLILFFAISCSHQNQSHSHHHVTIIKQWHLSPRLDTTNIEVSKKVPQYENQIDIYKILGSKAENNEEIYLLVEGCQKGKKINKNFSPSFNGWTMPTLISKSSSPNYADILTSLPMKLVAKYPKYIQADCADDEELIKKDQLAISNAKGFLGFYIRLKEGQNNQKKFESYHKALEETQNQKITNPVEYAKKKAIESLYDFHKYIKERNSEFVQMAKKNITKNPIIIIGGNHAEDLKSQLEAALLHVEVITPRGYPVNSEKLSDDLLKELNK